MVTVDQYRFHQGKDNLGKELEGFFNKDVFGIGCGGDFTSALKKFHALQLLECPEGLTREDVNCLENVVSNNC